MKQTWFTSSSICKTLEEQSSSCALLEALVVVGLIGWLDRVSGWEYSFFAFYALPIVFVVWKTDWRLGYVFALLCTATWWVVHIGNNPYHSGFGFALTVFGRWFYFTILVVALAAVKQQHELDRGRIQRLERAQQLETDILWASEREQQRIGRDLHDSLGPHLAAIGYAAAFLGNDLRLRNQPEAAKAEHLHEQVVEAASLLRDLVQGIFPEQINGFGLSVALDDLASTLSHLSGITVSYYETGNARVNDPETDLQLYRLVQEAVNNALKHGNAGMVTIVLNNSKDLLHLAITDDGTGMTLAPNGSRGIGLSSMRYRARALGGDLTIESKINEGTSVSCIIPNRPAFNEMPT